MTTLFNSETYKKHFAEFEQLLNKAEEQGQITLSEGNILKGRVVEIQPKRVMVDVGYKAEGAVSIEEFLIGGEGQPQVKIGDNIDVLVERVEDDWGIVILSKEKADRLKKWDEIELVAQGEGIILGKVVGKVKGGLSVDIGVRAFLPGSQVDIRPSKNLDDYVGQTYEFKIIKLNRFRNNIVVSRRALLEQARASVREEILGQLTVGDLVKGNVKNITDYGVFIDLGGIDGLLHITDMSWGRLDHPEEMLKLGQEIEVMVLSFDREKERVSLGLKQKTQDPWTQVEKKYPQGSTVVGKVVSIADYGCFIELEKGVEGLVHVSEMSWTSRSTHPSDIVKVGENINVVIQSIDMDNRRIGLSIRQTQPNPWLEAAKMYPTGTVIEGTIKNVTDFGIFVGVDEHIDGLIHISDISWVRDFTHPSERYKKGDTVQAVVTNVDIENERFSLSIKQLAENPWERIAKQHPVGSALKTKVVNKTEFGAFVEIEQGIEGLLHRSEIPGEELNNIQVGDVLDLYMLRISPSEQKISLTLRDLSEERFVPSTPEPVQSELERQLKERFGTKS